MSEFSESYHLRSSRVEHAVDLLRNARLKGYVYPPKNGWTTFVVAEGRFEPDSRIVQQNPGFLLHYVSAEDHGWSFAFYDKATLKLKYSCEWDDEVRFDDSLCSEGAFRNFVAEFGVDLPKEAWPQLCPADIDEAIDSEPAKALAETLGLGFYEWLAFDYAATDYHSPRRLEGVVEVK